MLTKFKLTALAIILLLSACSMEEISEKIIPEDVRERLDLITEAVTDRDHDTLIVLSVVQMSDEDLYSKLDQIFGYLPDGPVMSRQLAGFQAATFNFGGENANTVYSASYQFEFTDGWALVQIQLSSSGDTFSLVGLHVNRLEESLSETNAFVFSGKGFVHYLVFFLAVLFPVFIVWTFICCFRRREIRRRKRWLAFIFFGVGSFAINWTTGEFAVQLLSIGLLGAGFTMSSMLAPVILKVWFPLGAALFWILTLSGRLGLEDSASSQEEGATEK